MINRSILSRLLPLLAVCIPLMSQAQTAPSCTAPPVGFVEIKHYYHDGPHIRVCMPEGYIGIREGAEKCVLRTDRKKESPSGSFQDFLDQRFGVGVTRYAGISVQHIRLAARDRSILTAYYCILE